MDLTQSFLSEFPPQILDRYTFIETRNAAAVLRASNPEQFGNLVDVLCDFYIYDSDIRVAGGNRGTIASRLDGAFEDLGWRAVRVNTEFRLVGKMKASQSGVGYDVPFHDETVHNDGFEVDNLKGRVALDVEWNAKDGNLDRDLAAYRSLYDHGMIDAAVMITRDHYSIRALAAEDLQDAEAARRLSTTTTTNTEKLRPRMTRGDSGGCPLLAIGISRNTWAGPMVPPPRRKISNTLSDLSVDVDGLLDDID